LDPKSIVQLNANELSQKIHQREISCTEVMTAYLEQIDQMNPKVNAIVSRVDSDILLNQALQKDQEFHRVERGWMYGFPLAPKDLTMTIGITSTLGSPIFQHQVPKHDSIVVERMRSAGAIMIGKTNIPEFALGSHTYNPVYGTTLNAYDQTKSAGGSSGGAAVALALQMMPVADGSDMGGSLRNPAGWNNIYGFRPSRGRVPAGPASEVYFEQLATEGPMARNVEDLAQLLAVQAGYDPRSPLSLKDSPEIFRQSLDKSFKGTKIGWMGNLEGYLATEPGVIDVCQGSLKYFDELGCQVDAVTPQFDMANLWQAWLKIRAFLAGGKLNIHYQNDETRKLLKPEAVWEIEQSLKLNPIDLYRASEVRTAWTMEMNHLFETYDYLVLPSAQVFPFDQQMTWPSQINGVQMDTYHRWMEVVIGPTLAGLPTLSIPAGFKNGADSQLPMGIQLIGRPQADLSVLQLGHAWHQTTPFKDFHPKLLDI